MKKKLVTILGLAMIVGCMSACGTNATTENAQPVDIEEAEATTEVSTETETTETETTEAETTEAETTETKTTVEETFSNDDFSVKYNTNNFELFDVNGAIQFSYVNEEVDAAGSNVVIITKEENSQVEDILNTITESRNDMEDIYDSVIGAQEIPVKIFAASSSASEDSNLRLVDNIILMQSGDDVILIEIIRTVGPNDETEMTIDGAFTTLFESFELNK